MSFKMTLCLTMAHYSRLNQGREVNAPAYCVFFDRNNLAPIVVIKDYFFTFSGLTQSSKVTCGTRDRVSLCAGASLVMVEPAPIVAPSPTETGATNCVHDPIKA